MVGQTDEQKVSIVKKAEKAFKKTDKSQHVLVCADCLLVLHLGENREVKKVIRLDGFLHESIWACSEKCYVHLKEICDKNCTKTISSLRVNAGTERKRVFNLLHPNDHYI